MMSRVLCAGGVAVPKIECSRRGCYCEVKYRDKDGYWCTFHVPNKIHAHKARRDEVEL